MDPKHKADLIIAIGKGHKPDEMPEEDGGDKHEALKSALEDFAKALDAKDFDLAAQAFSDACELCEQEEGPEAPEDSEG